MMVRLQAVIVVACEASTDVVVTNWPGTRTGPIFLRLLADDYWAGLSIGTEQSAQCVWATSINAARASRSLLCIKSVHLPRLYIETHNSEHVLQLFAAFQKSNMYETYLIIEFYCCFCCTSHCTTHSCVKAKHAWALSCSSSLMRHDTSAWTDTETCSMTYGLIVANKIVELYGIAKHHVLLIFDKYCWNLNSNIMFVL